MITALTLDFSLRFSCNLGSMASARHLDRDVLTAQRAPRRESRGRGDLRLIEPLRVSHRATADYSCSYGYRRVGAATNSLGSSAFK